MAYAAAHGDLRQLVGSLRTTGEDAGPGKQRQVVWPFITISRQAGAGGRDLGMALVRRLNERITTEHPWQFFDRELVEKIASDHHLSTDLVRGLERSSHSWVAEFFSGLSHADKRPSEATVFKRVVETMRALGQAGHVILVGLGGVFITWDMPGALHVRLVAPFEWRAAHLAKTDNLTIERAREKVKLLDRNREAFFATYWPGQPIATKGFHVTFDAGLVSEERMADAVLALVKEPVA